MQITLNEKEIKRAIVAYVAGRVEITGDVVVNLTAGRSPNGMSAAIDITEDEGNDLVDTQEDPPFDVDTDSEGTEPVEDSSTEPVEESDESPLFGS